ncbi:MAG: thermonuclease family protein [candidate division WOR-3 bacterium]
MLDFYHTADLINNTFDDIEKFTFNGLLTKAKVIDVYDGDTLTIVFYYNNQPIKDSFRMYGYDAPEMKPPKTLKNRELHIKAATHVRDYLRNKLLGKIVWVKFCQEEKYGRLMGILYFISPTHENYFNGEEININQLIIQKGYGKEYKGGKKEQFTDDELIAILT